MKLKPRHIILPLLAVSLAFGGSSYAKSLTEKISARFANIKLIVNGKTIDTKAEPFIYNGNVYAPVANKLGIKQDWDNKTPAVRFSSGNPVPQTVLDRLPEPITQDYSNPRTRSPQKHLLSKNFINMSGASSSEFLVNFVYSSVEGIPYDSYASLFRYEQGQAKLISTIHLFEGESGANADVSQPSGDVVYNPDTKEIYVHRHAFKLITTPTTSSFGKGELLESSIVQFKNGKLVKTDELKKG
ncbi:UNVERIFIED_CONTAM: hypothetical protein ABID98_005465 [Brevibacillus sp. OAP136]